MHGIKALAENMSNSVSSHMTTPSFLALIELYKYLRDMASLTTSQAPPPMEKEIEYFHVFDQGIHPLFGLCRPLYVYLTRINDLLPSNTAGSRMETTAELRRIEHELHCWHPPQAQVEILSGKGYANHHRSEAIAMASATRWAVLIYMCHGEDPSVFQKDYEESTKVNDYVESIISDVSLVRPGSEMDARMLFPLFMAGLGSTTKSQRLTIAYRLNMMETTVGFRHITVAHEILDETWRKRLSGQEVPDWKIMAKETHRGLVLF